MKSSIKIFAHRGASHIYPENTLPAFQEAVKRGATGLELDVQLSKDGYPVVIHDEHLSRTTNGKGLVKNHTLRQLKSLNAGSWFHSRFSHLKIPTLEEILIKAKPHPIHLNIELKNLLIRSEHLEEAVIQLIHKYDFSSRVILSSFNPESLRLVREIDTSIATGLLYFGKLDEPWKMAREIGAQYLEPPIEILTPDFVRKCHRQHLQVCPYNVNKWMDIYRAMDCQVDGIITMFPERVRRFVE